MTREEKIDKIYDIVIRLEPMVVGHDKSIYGNGQKGLKERVDVMETMQRDCMERRKAEPANRSNLIALAALFLCAIGLWIQAKAKL